MGLGGPGGSGPGEGGFGGGTGVGGDAGGDPGELGLGEEGLTAADFGDLSEGELSLSDLADMGFDTSLGDESVTAFGVSWGEQLALSSDIDADPGLSFGKAFSTGFKAGMAIGHGNPVVGLLGGLVGLGFAAGANKGGSVGDNPVEPGMGESVSEVSSSRSSLSYSAKARRLVRRKKQSPIDLYYDFFGGKNV